MIFDALIGQMKFSGQVSIDRVLARRMSGGPDPKFSVNSLGFPAGRLEGLPAVLFIRRLCGGLAGLTPNSPQRRY